MDEAGSKGARVPNAQLLNVLSILSTARASVLGTCEENVPISKPINRVVNEIVMISAYIEDLLDVNLKKEFEEVHEQFTNGLITRIEYVNALQWENLEHLRERKNASGS